MPVLCLRVTCVHVNSKAYVFVLVLRHVCVCWSLRSGVLVGSRVCVFMLCLWVMCLSGSQWCVCVGC